MTKAFKPAQSVVLAIVLLMSCFSVMAYAQIPSDDGSGITPYATTITDSGATITISGITAYMDADVSCNPSSSLSIVMELQKLKSGSYETIETYTNSTTGKNLSLSESRLINALSTYRLKVTFTAGSETEIRYAYPA